MTQLQRTWEAILQVVNLMLVGSTSFESEPTLHHRHGVDWFLLGSIYLCVIALCAAVITYAKVQVARLEAKVQ